MTTCGASSHASVNFTCCPQNAASLTSFYQMDGGPSWSAHSVLQPKNVRASVKKAIENVKQLYLENDPHF